MNKYIGLLHTYDSPEHLKSAAIWLQQFGDVRTVDYDQLATEREDIKLLIIPDGNFVDSSIPGITGKKTLTPIMNQPVSVASATFRDYTLETYIEKEIPIFGIGRAADMLWLKLGNKLSITPYNREIVTDEQMIALTSDRMNQRIKITEDNAVGREGFAFFKAILPNISIWQVNENTKQQIISWSTYLDKHKMNNAVKKFAAQFIYDEIVARTNQATGFYDKDSLIIGLKFIPYLRVNPQTSFEFSVFNHHIGDIISNKLVEELLMEYDPANCK